MKNIDFLVIYVGFFIIFSASASSQSITTTTFPMPVDYKAPDVGPLILSKDFSTFGSSIIAVGPGESIQVAIDSASPGDMIMVAAGTYNERVRITKSNLQIIGEDKYTTIINGGNANTGDCVHIFANNVEFSNFGLKNCYSGAVAVWADGVSITDLNIYDVKNGIVAMECTNLLIARNKVRNAVYGLVYQTSDGGSIINNDVADIKYGIWLFSSNENTVSENIVDTNRVAFGIQLNAGSYGNNIVNNRLSDNHWGLLLDGTSSNTISQNRMCDNYPWDVYDQKSVNIFEENTCTNTYSDAGVPTSAICKYSCVETPSPSVPEYPHEIFPFVIILGVVSITVLATSRSKQ
jgi:parallel beta-helix repeat protein